MLTRHLFARMCEAALKPDLVEQAVENGLFGILQRLPVCAVRHLIQIKDQLVVPQ